MKILTPLRRMREVWRIQKRFGGSKKGLDEGGACENIK
jgi:hypothetical protein